MLVVRVHQIPSRAGVSVVHVITDAGPHPYFRTLIEAGGFDRARLSVGCVGTPGALQDDMRSLGVSTFALGARSRAAYPAAIARLARKLRRQRIEVVQTHLVDGSFVGLTAARLARTPVAVMTAHHSHELPFHGRRLIWPERLCTGPLCDHIIAPSQDVLGTLTRIAHVPAQKIEVVHHGFDLELLDPGNADSARVRAELGLKGKLVFGAIGRLYALKNYAGIGHGVRFGPWRSSRCEAVDRRRGRQRPACGPGKRARNRRPGPGMWSAQRHPRCPRGDRCLRASGNRRVVRDGDHRGDGDGEAGV